MREAPGAIPRTRPLEGRGQVGGLLAGGRHRGRLAGGNINRSGARHDARLFWVKKSAGEIQSDEISEV
jgi:hypothetical protein